MPDVPAPDAAESNTTVPGLGGAVVLAGGGGSRLGGRDKVMLEVAGRTLLQTALDSVAGAITVVVGPPRELPTGTLSTIEDPPRGGPAAALSAGLQLLGELPGDAAIAVIAADLPALGPAAVRRLVTELAAKPAASGAVLLDASGRRQYSIGVWRADALRAAVAVRPSWTGQPLHDLLDPLIGVEVPTVGDEAADIDTPQDLSNWLGNSPL